MQLNKVLNAGQLKKVIDNYAANLLLELNSIELDFTMYIVLV